MPDDDLRYGMRFLIPDCRAFYVQLVHFRWPGTGQLLPYFCALKQGQKFSKGLSKTTDHSHTNSRIIIRRIVLNLVVSRQHAGGPVTTSVVDI